MEYNWLNKNNNRELIVFFGGWSFDSHPFECMDSGNRDILMFYDYSDLNIPENILNEISNYSEKTLIAWSMGVFTAYYLKTLPIPTLLTLSREEGRIPALHTRTRTQ